MKSDPVHVGCADQVAVTDKFARRALPAAVIGFMPTAALRTPAGGPSFLPSEARHAGQRGFVPQIRKVFAHLPAVDPPIMVPVAVQVAHPARVTHEEGPHAFLTTKVDHLPGAFVAQVPHAPFGERRAFTSRPARPFLPCFTSVFVQGNDVVPQPCGFLLGFFEGGLQGRTQPLQGHY